MALSNDISALIGFACETTLWGVYCVLFALSLGLLYRRNQKLGDMNSTILVTHCLLFGASTAHYALEFNHFYTVLQATGVPGFANETKPLVGADLLISLADLLGDSVLIYRCWILWRGNYWVVGVPIMSAIAGFACLSQVVHFVVTQSPTSPVPPTAQVPLTVAGYALPLCTNVIASGLLVFKIWWMARGTRSGHTLQRTIRLANDAAAVIVESGLIYLATQLVLVVLVTIEHPAQAIVGVMAVPIYGIASTLIVIRVTLGISAGSSTKETEHVSQLVWARSAAGPSAGEFSHVAAGTGSTGVGGSSTRVLGEDVDVVECLELKLEGGHGTTAPSDNVLATVV
ncbi:uncharacterized protein TRAVEDRAFT_131226 [Trametes versicolor FP-101664 SS1]|uniref:uncharacterized protein n=1 Tax=Trametes versicolor (strain FP-101664) TaxID=717944 RepID=UPI0004624954|nr:uncharacterized protein TRAVEDRAFT_131226 [Trametes versicolor FP-101664 SS1]EIW55056.1 hypothetical protein TRAVEDRAFT_131226 [Trametes versicolor FP-101664 SS1]